MTQLLDKNPGTNASANAGFLGLILKGSKSRLLLETLCNLGVQMRNSAHDGCDEHQVLEVNHGFLEFYDAPDDHESAVLAIESDDIDTALAALPKGYQIVYRGETDLDRYNTVAICHYSQGFQVKLYERNYQS